MVPALFEREINY